MSAACARYSADRCEICGRHSCVHAVGRRIRMGLSHVYDQKGWYDAVADARIGTDVRHGRPARRRHALLRPVVGNRHRRRDLR